MLLAFTHTAHVIALTCADLNIIPADTTTQTAGTYVVTIENEHGTDQCSATLIVTQDAKEMEDWISQLKKAYVHA